MLTVPLQSHPATARKPWLRTGFDKVIQLPKMQNMQDSVVPVATPSRALAMFWSKYKVDKNLKPDGATMPEPAPAGTMMVSEPAIPEVAPAVEAGLPQPSDPDAKEVVVVVDSQSSAPTELDRPDTSSSVDTFDLESSSKYDEKCKRREAKLADAVPGDAPPYDGPTISSQLVPEPSLAVAPVEPAMPSEPTPVAPASEPTLPPTLPSEPMPVPPASEPVLPSEPMPVAPASEPVLPSQPMPVAPASEPVLPSQPMPVAPEQPPAPMEVDPPAPSQDTTATVPATLAAPATTGEPVAQPTEALVQEFNRLTSTEMLEPIFTRLSKLDQVQIDRKIHDIQVHPSLRQFEAYITKIGGEPYTFGNDDSVHEIAVFGQWCEAEQNYKRAQEPPPTPRVSALRAALTRATTVDLAPNQAKQPQVKVEPMTASAEPSAPVMSSVFGHEGVDNCSMYL